MARDPLAAMAGWQKEFGDLVHLRIWPEHQVIVAAPELARELLVGHHDALIRWERGIEVMSQLHGASVLMAEGERWKVKRHAMQADFAPRMVQTLVPVFTDATASAMAAWHPGAAPWPIESALTSLAMEVIMRMMFSSTRPHDVQQAERAVRDVSAAGNAELYWPASWPDAMPWKRGKRRALAVLNDFIGRHIAARLAHTRGAWPQDQLSRLLSLHFDDPAAWPIKAVHDECMTSFLAGHETVAATLTWWAWCMAANPEIQEKAREEVRQRLQGMAPAPADMPALSYLGATLQETLRLYPAAPLLLTRRAVRPISLGGWQFPARTMFTVPVQLMQRDARWFPEPESFRPERFGPGAPLIPRGAMMPFGAGPRVCLGQHMAMTEMTTIAAMFLQRFVVKVPPGMAPPTPVLHITMRPAAPLHLQLDTL